MNPVEVKQPKIFKMTTQRKHSPGQERSWVNKQVEDAVKGQDHQDESAVKENPTIQEKSRPREQAKRNSSDSSGGTEAGSSSPDRPEKRGD